MSIDMPVNRFKQAIAARQPQIGLWSSLTGTVGAEIGAGAGFDWILLDSEHSPNDIASLLLALQTVAPYPTQAIVRPPIGDAVTIKRLLDIGAQTLLIPMVETVEQAQALVAATRYPPDGVRGVSSQTRAGRWGRINGYLKQAGEDICLLVQIESIRGLDNAAAIAAVDGVDGVFVGPSDLAAALGHLGETGHADVTAAVERAGREIMAAGKPAGILIPDEKLAHHYLALGFTFVAVGVDTMLLARATSDLRQRFA